MESPALLRTLIRSRARVQLARISIRNMLTHNLGLKVVAIILAIVMWGFVAVQRRGETTELRFTSTLVFRNIPPNVELVHAPVQSVSVLVRAQRRMVTAINPNQFQVFVDLANQLPGQVEYDLTPRNVSYLNVSPPDGMSVLQISPTTIPFQLEETLTKELAIQPLLSGTLAPGFALGQVQVQPRMAEVIGPRSVVEGLRALTTRPLDVQDLHSNVEMLAPLDLPTGVRLAGKQDAFFRAQISVTGNPTRILLRDIPVVFENVAHTYKVSTTSLNVHLEGTKEALAELNRGNVFATIDLGKYPPGDYRGVVPRVVLPDNVRVLEQWPIVDLYVFKKDIPGAEIGKDPPK
jgi:YbbR domain-containing protein